MHVNVFFIEKVYKKLKIDNVITVFSLVRAVNPPQASKKGHFTPVCWWKALGIVVKNRFYDSASASGLFLNFLLFPLKISGS